MSGLDGIKRYRPASDYIPRPRVKIGTPVLPPTELLVDGQTIRISFDERSGEFRALVRLGTWHYAYSSVNKKQLIDQLYADVRRKSPSGSRSRATK
jgi:hypothetical protein